jgi:CRP/FNR family cyclic AMP-dependent transcriptional regulator
LRSLLAGESDAVTRRVAKRSNVYVGGSRDDKVYFIAAGQVKVVMLSPGGKECLLAIYTTGDFFGESCLSGGPRIETAIAMSDTVLKQMQGAGFLALMAEAGLVGDFVRYLAVRLAEQQQIITNLATVDCEYRLGEVLLRLARKLGSGGARGLPQKISHQELSQMVGTTRPRISEFMQRFRDLGLIDMTPDAHILIREQHLKEYLDTRGLKSGLHAVAS